MEMESISLSIWFLIGASLVFFMQCGFAMVECGFTRAKNAGNIIMKNLMDFCIGTVMFIILGYGIMMNPHVAGGFIGTINWDMFGSGFSGFSARSFRNGCTGSERGCGNYSRKSACGGNNRRRESRL